MIDPRVQVIAASLASLLSLAVLYWLVAREEEPLEEQASEDVNAEARRKMGSPLHRKRN